MTNGVKHRTVNGTIEYFDENRGWIAANEYFDMVEEKNDPDDIDLQIGRAHV